MSTNNVIEDIASGILSSVLLAPDRFICEPFWTNYQTKVVSNRLLRAKYWNEDPLKNLGEILNEALGKPILKVLRIKNDEYLYYNLNSRIISTEDNTVSVMPLVKDDYTSSDNGSIKVEIHIFPATETYKQRRVLHLTIFKKIPEYAAVIYGDSCIVAEALIDDDSTTNMIIAPKVLFSVNSAMGEFEGLSGMELQTSADGKGKIILRYN